MKKTFLIIAFITLLIIIPAHAQTSVDEVVITNAFTDAEIFPEVIVDGYFLQPDGSLASGISKDMLQVTENGSPVDFELQQVEAGSYTVIVFDIGNWVTNKLALENTRVRDVMQKIANNVINAMGERDFVQIIAIYDDEPIVAQNFTNDQDSLKKAVSQLRWDADGRPFGYEALGYAVSSLKSQEDVLKKQILFLSPGIMNTNVYGETPKSVSEAASLAGIPIHAVNISTNWDYKLYGGGIEYISTETNGVFVPYNTEKDLTTISSVFVDHQYAYQITYRSLDGQSTQRTIELVYTGTGQVSDSTILNIDPALISPIDVTINVNAGSEIVINAEKEDEQVPIQVILSGVGNRRISDVSFLIDGNRLGSLSPDDAGVYTTVWNLSAKDANLPRGDTQVSVQVNVLDELGVIHQGTVASTITVETTPIQPCKALSDLGASDGLVDTCVQSGITVTALIFILIALVLAILLWLKRDTVAEISKKAGVRITNAVERLTNRLTPLKPKARLVAIKGIADTERKEFDIFGVTPIGVDREFSKLILDNPNISGLHCTLQETHEGVWTIEDQESTNGTFVNGERLTPFSPREIETEAMIELAPVERGGIKFRFEIIDPYAEDYNDFSDVYEDKSTNADEKNNEGVRITQRNTQPRDEVEESIDKEVMDNTDNDSTFDPSDPANQSW